MSMTFEDLESWNKARELVNKIYAMAPETSLARDFGLCGQIQRAAVCAMSNVAEGFERAHSPEKLQAYNVARPSCAEGRSLLYVIEDHYSASASVARGTRQSVGHTGSLISGLIASSRKRIAAKVAGSAIVLVCVAWLGFHLLR